MRKFRVIKIIVAFTLTVAMVLCSSVFVSAYVPFFKHDSSEWTITSDDMMSAVYPESIPNYHFNDIVYSFLNSMMKLIILHSIGMMNIILKFGLIVHICKTKIVHMILLFQMKHVK